MIRKVVFRHPTLRGAVRAAPAVALAAMVAACAGAAPGTTPPIVPGSTDAPREVNLITRDYSFVPGVLDLVPGETIRLHVINGGLAVHEAVIGDASVQEAWETAEAATVGAPPGPTPLVTVPAGREGLRVVVQSGERIDVTWTVPSAAVGSALGPPGWLVGCHIPGHWARGMQIPIRWVSPGSAGATRFVAR
ncbi:MAG TPA: hypothetical protein VFW02_10170 [Candidatus Limnocylindrales bacterium]|nr:hypothetical protein [Candidatus Limnocylindrales bacterium]